MALPKENLEEFLKKNKGYKVLKRLEDTTIIKLPNGELLKVLDKELLLTIKDTGYDLERRLDEADSFTSFKNFSIPTRKLEHNGRISAYTMPNFPGINFTDYYVDIFNLKKYAKTHAQIEENIKKGNELGLVFPDLCTTENIIIMEDGKVYFIDYDGIQIKDMPAVGYSTFLGSPDSVLTPKYYNEKKGLFTKELDIKSAIFLYFVDVFGVNLSVANTINPYTGKKVTLDYIFSMINLQAPSIQHKVWKLFQEQEKNEFLGDDMYILAEKYNLMPDMPDASLKNL
ncbi:MAG: hypothetical protein OSJ70_08085 [Bacilli bacterium]|nr:hypothetical protein [Bacilli bacterium]